MHASNLCVIYPSNEMIQVVFLNCVTSPVPTRFVYRVPQNPMVSKINVPICSHEKSHKIAIDWDLFKPFLDRLQAVTIQGLANLFPKPSRTALTALAAQSWLGDEHWTRCRWPNGPWPPMKQPERRGKNRISERCTANSLY